MAISRITGQTATGNGSSHNASATYASATTAGNLLIATVSCNLAGTATITAGGTWTKLITEGTSGNSINIFYKLADGTETTITANNAGDGNVCIDIFEYTGNANPIQIDGTAAGATAGSSVTTLATPGITTTNAGDLIFVAAGTKFAPSSPSWTTSTLLGSNGVNTFAGQFCGEHIVTTPQTGFSDTAHNGSAQSFWDVIICAFVSAPVHGIAGCIGWWDASTLGLSNGASVTSWPGNIGPAMTSANNSGGGPTPHTAPTFETNVQNSLPVVRFNGTTDYLSAGNVNSTASPAMVFVVAKTAENPFTDYRGAFTSDTNGVGGDFVLIANSGTADFYPGQADQVYYLNGTNTTSTFAAPALNTFAYMSMQSATYSSPFYPMVGLTEFGSTRVWLGDIAEIIVYNTQLGTTDRQSVETYLNNKWFGTSAITISVSDTTTTSETVDALRAGARNISVSDTTTTSETVNKILVSSINTSDTTITSESVTTLPIGIYFDASSNSGYKASFSSYSWSHTTTGINRGLVVNVSIFVTGSVTGITYNGVAMQFIRADTIGVYRNEIWALGNPTIGTNTIAVTLNTSLTSIAGADSYTGVDTTEMVEANAGTTGSGISTPSLAITTLSDQSWVVDGLTTSDTTMTVSGGQTQRNNQTGALGTGGIGDKGPITPVGSTTMSWSAVTITDSWALGVIALDPANEAFTASIAVSDTTTTSEVVKVVIIALNIGVSDSTTTSELVSLLIPTLSISVTDTTITSENVIVQIPVAGVLNVSVSDTSTTTESITLLSIDSVSVSDTTTTSELVNLNTIGFVSPTDTTITSESVKLLITSSISVSDTTTTSESVRLLIPTLFVTVSDTIVTSESVTAQIPVAGVLSVIVSDTTITSELTNLVVTPLLAGVSDLTTTSENVSLFITNRVSVSDTTTTSENVTVTIGATPQISIAVSDTVTTSESIKLLITTLFIKVSDTTTTSEFVGVNAIRFSVSDTVTTSETVSIISYIPNPIGRVTVIPLVLNPPIILSVILPPALTILDVQPPATVIPVSVSSGIALNLSIPVL